MFVCLFLVVNIVTPSAIAKLAENEVIRCSSDHAVGRFNEFKCQNGTCIDLKHVCDGIQHCPDASDESFCKYSRKRLTRSNDCFLPEYPKQGTYEVLNNPNARPGQNFDSFLLTVRCRRGYGVVNKDGSTGSSSKAFCINGMWDQNMPQCVRFCRLNPDPSVRYMCRVPGIGLQVCGNYVAPGTFVSPICNTPIYYSTKSFPNMKCTSGLWNYVAQCEVECGRVTPEAFQLVIDGKEAKRGELPWHVGIYRKKPNPFEQICGGTLISNNVVISAAHCFWNDIRKRLPASDYSVAIGKLYRAWDSEMDIGVQKSDVKEIKIPILFEGESANFQEDIAALILTTPFIYKTYIRPVCLNFDVNFERWQLQQDNLGKVAGWGLTAANGNASPTLKVVEMPFISESICIKTLPQSFREYITGDKFCAGYTNGTALCRGDSGGGLAFSERELGIDRYYLRGIVSAAPRNDEKKCNDNAYTTFTKITKHQELINEALAESAVRSCPFYSFQCDDGTCVDLGADCNGIRDCADGSDESDEQCKPGADTPDISKLSGCFLPPYPDHGTYEVPDFPNARPGQRVERSILNVVCSEGYHVLEANGERKNNSVVYCKNRVFEKLPKCVPSVCEWYGIKGQCVPSSMCPSALDDSLNGPKPPLELCAYIPNETPLMCCLDCYLVNDRRPLLSKPVLANLNKTGTSKAKNKCLEYIQTLDYPCKKKMGNIKFQLDQAKRCFRKVDVELSGSRGIGRSDALREEFPHMALLGFKDTLDVESWVCGGTVISERFILTAAHCVNNPSTGPVRFIGLGILKRSDPIEVWQRYNVKRIIHHPKYSPRFRYHDIALLETDKEIALNSAVLPACLHVDDATETSYGHVTGWGNRNQHEELSDTLHSVSIMAKNINADYYILSTFLKITKIFVRRTSEEECAKQYPPSRRLVNGYDNSTQMCYGEEKGIESTCQGDSGGPLQSRDQEQCESTIIGVLSFGNSCGTLGEASVYTRVKYYVPWIEEIVWP